MLFPVLLQSVIANRQKGYVEYLPHIVDLLEFGFRWQDLICCDSCNPRFISAQPLLEALGTTPMNLSEIKGKVMKNS